MLINGSALNETPVGSQSATTPKTVDRMALVNHERMLGFDELGFDVKAYRGMDAKRAVEAMIVEGLAPGWELVSIRYLVTGQLTMDRIVEVRLTNPLLEAVKYEIRVPFDRKGLWAGKVPFVLRDYVAIKTSA